MYSRCILENIISFVNTIKVVWILHQQNIDVCLFTDLGAIVPYLQSKCENDKFFPEIKFKGDKIYLSQVTTYFLPLGEKNVESSDNESDVPDDLSCTNFIHSHLKLAKDDLVPIEEIEYIELKDGKPYSTSGISFMIQELEAPPHVKEDIIFGWNSYFLTYSAKVGNFYMEVGEITKVEYQILPTLQKSYNYLEGKMVDIHQYCIDYGAIYMTMGKYSRTNMKHIAECNFYYQNDHKNKGISFEEYFTTDR